MDLVIFLTAPIETLVKRLPRGRATATARNQTRFVASSTTFGPVEPRLRQVADHEVRTSVPLEEVVTTVLSLAERLET